MARHQKIAKLFDEDFGVCNDEVRGRGLRTRGGSGRREGDIGILNFDLSAFS